MRRVKANNLFVLSGPSGLGKTTLINQLLSAYPNDIVFPLTYTTRQPREGEKNGKDFFFISNEEYKKMLRNNEFVATTNAFDNFYGTKKLDLYSALDTHKRVIVALDDKGAEDIRLQGIGAVYVFLAPTDLEVLKQRLQKRYPLVRDREELQRRLEDASEQLDGRWRYDYLLLSGTNNKDFVFEQMATLMGLKK